MDLITTSVTSGIISSFIGKQLFTQAISDASSSIYNSLFYIFNYDDNIDNFFKDLDIYNKIKNIELLIININTHKSNNSVINKCIEDLHDIIITIREDIKQINHKIQKHKNLYFPKWRYLNCSKEKNNIILHNNILDKRLNFFFKAIKTLCIQ